MAARTSLNISADASIAPPRTAEGGSRFRSALWTLILLLIVGFLGYYYFIGRVDEKLTGEILKRIRQELPSHIVSLDRATLQPGKSILLEGLRIQKPTKLGPRDVFRCGRLECLGPIDWISLAQKQLAVKSVIADGVEVSVWPLSENQWSVQELSKDAPLSELFPDIQVRSGLVRIGSETGEGGREIVCHDLVAKIGLLPRVVDQQIAPLGLEVNASLSSSYFSLMKITARTDQTKKNWQARGTLQKLEYSPRLAMQLPQVLRNYLSKLDGLSAEITAKFEGSLQQGHVNYTVQGDVSEGRWNHPMIPFSMDTFAGDFHCQNGMLQIRNFVAKSSETTIRANLDWNGLSLQSPLTAIVSVQDLELDQKLYKSIPRSIQEIWTKIRPTGKVDAYADIRFDGSRWHPNIEVNAKDCSVDSDYFPYPVGEIQGVFHYQDGRLNAPELVGEARGVRVKSSLELVRASPRWLMDFSISADSPIPIDDRLIAALTPRGTEPGGFQKFVHSLHPQGTVHLKYGQFRRTADHPDTVSRYIELTFSECAIKYDHFKYPIVDVHGEATVDNDRLILRDFVGRNDGARIKAYGICQGREGALELADLEFNVYDIALDEELQSALPAGVRSLWDELQPTGSMDHVRVTMTQNGLEDPLDLRVEMNESRDPNGNVGRSVAFRPTSIPYSIHDVACNIRYRPGRIDIVSLSGHHEMSRLLASGHCHLYSNGTWDGTIGWLETTRFLVDQNLLKSLPPYLRDPLLRLDFRGPISVTGSTRIASPRDPADSVVRAWDLDLQIEDGRLGGGGIASGIRGSIALEGQNTLSGPIAYGTMELDALSIKGIAVTGLKGPFSLTQNDLYFGRDAVAWQEQKNIKPSRNAPLYTVREEQIANAVHRGGSQHGMVVQAGAIRDTLHTRLDAKFAAMSKPEPEPNLESWTPPTRDIPPLDLSIHDVRARALSGTVFLSGTEPLNGNRARYKLRLVDSHLSGCLLDLGETNATANGRLSVQCDVQGSLTNLSSIEGTGNAWLRDAKLYELPVMIRLFRLLSVRPDQGAFDAADVNFSIDGERFPIHELLLDGDLVSMKGNGWVNMRRELQLDLQANVSRRTIVGAMMRPLAPNNSANLFRIEVTGTASDPQVRRSMGLMNTWEPVLTDPR